MGGYVSHLFGLPQSYYFGIRRYPSTDMTKNPLTFGHISQQVYDGSIPRNPTRDQHSSSRQPRSTISAKSGAPRYQEMRQPHRKDGFAVGNKLAP